MIERLFRAALGIVVTLAGLAGAAWAGRAFLQGFAVRTWDRSECWVDDVRIITLEPDRKLGSGGHYDVLFRLRERETGVEFVDMPATLPRPVYHDDFDLQREVLPAVPGALIDCWIDPTRTVAYVRRTARFVLGIELIGALLSLFFAMGGVMILRPNAFDGAFEALERRIEEARSRG